jgi:hypothetical protein
MSSNTTQIATTALERSISNTQLGACIDQRISAEMVTTSQASMPMNMANMIPRQSTDELLKSRREARRRQRRRRAQRRQQRRSEPEHQQQARQIRRRHMANQELQQRLHYQQSREHEINVRRRSSVVNKGADDGIEERLLEAYDWEMMPPTDRWEQGHINDLEGMAALERLVLVQDEVESLERVHTRKASHGGDQDREEGELSESD